MLKALNYYNEAKDFGGIEVDTTCGGTQYAFEEYMNKKYDRDAPCTWSGELWESGEWLFQAIAREYGNYGAVMMFNQYKPERPFRKDEALFSFETNADETPRCTRTECAYNEINTDSHWNHCSFATYITGCMDNECGDLIITFIIGGWSGLKEYESTERIHPEVFRFLEKIWDKKYVGIKEFEIYGRIGGKLNGLQVLNPFAIATSEFAEDMEDYLVEGKDTWFIHTEETGDIEVKTFRWDKNERGEMILYIND